ncbi:MAG TPA: V-type ATP synthase subunit D [Candidatus Aphodoplasma excrementigallinarum]|uniref:V-type ATP synthase subunit D n=1 Tax=Candidatus Aphodoplasma excrementigallinarum TaxID=2840673 RepID=A0A9D1NFE4_9FIRM|nr:V-type ATP synthase subunit D [Candidatus Aphodoplasma excrementigallinarum]
MDVNLFPTKGNLILAKNTLALSSQGYELLDKKRNILIREMMGLIDAAKELQAKIETTFAAAYAALQRANITSGIEHVMEVGLAMPLEDGVRLLSRSVMGTEIPMVRCDRRDEPPQYGFYSTTSALDEARARFVEVKELSLRLAEVETSVYRLAVNIKKTQKRANALKNVTIPKYTSICKQIEGVLEEKEREEFARLKVIKGQKQQRGEA